jgi:hypothetical protein
MELCKMEDICKMEDGDKAEDESQYREFWKMVVKNGQVLPMPDILEAKKNLDEYRNSFKAKNGETPNRAKRRRTMEGSSYVFSRQKLEEQIDLFEKNVLRNCPKKKPILFRMAKDKSLSYGAIESNFFEEDEVDEEEEIPVEIAQSPKSPNSRSSPEKKGESPVKISLLRKKQDRLPDRLPEPEKVKVKKIPPAHRKTEKRTRWNDDEVERLKKGVAELGEGKWKQIAESYDLTRLFLIVWNFSECVSVSFRSNFCKLERQMEESQEE